MSLSYYWRNFAKKEKKIELRYLACSQIWLNLSVDHCPFGYITKLKKQNTDFHFG
jgi:hypothetical protein